MELVRRYEEAMAGWQLRDAREHRGVQLAGFVAGQEVGQDSLVGCWGDQPAGPERLRLRSEGELRLGLDVIERFDAEAVAATEELSAPAVPDRKGPHAVEALDAALAPLLIGSQQHLGVAGAAKGVAKRGQFGAQFDVVVDLAVETDGELAVGAAHGGVAARREVEDGQPALGQAKVRIARLDGADVRQVQRLRAIRAFIVGCPAAARVEQGVAFVVRPAMAEQIRHAAELMNAYRLPIEVEDAGDATHEATPVCDRGQMLNTSI